MMQKSGIELKIDISQGIEDKSTKSALWIDSERQVSSLMVTHSMLIYIISLTLQSTMNVIINNQCPNIELTSPVYFTKDTTCHIQFPQQMNSDSSVKVGFRTSINENMFGGVLLYHLQRKEDKSISVQLLVIWRCESDELYSYTWLIEHESTLVWNKDKLKILYDRYNIRYDTHEKWLLDDGTELETKCELTHGVSK
jgi:hypothetical protein